MAPSQMTRRGRGKGRGYLAKQVKTEETQSAEKIGVRETFNLFAIRFVRLNGILYTRTSLETFEEIFSLVVDDLSKLLCSGPDEELNFGSDITENTMVVLKIVTILIFTVHNVNKESEGQSYAEILQRSVLLQNAFTSAFEILGCILKRCVELQDVPSSYLLPGILVFVEWLACHPDIASGADVEEKQTHARSFFWNHFVSLMNRLLLSGLASFEGDKDEACFFDIGTYDEGETSNRLALWEDFELRGFVPLVPAQLILNFHSKHSFGSEVGIKEKKTRVQRILAAGKALMNMVQVDQQKIRFNSEVKKYIIGDYVQAHKERVPVRYPDFSEPNGFPPVNSYPVENTVDIMANQSNPQLFSEGDEEDEVIVFKPTVAEKSSSGLNPTCYDAVQPIEDECSTSQQPVYENIKPAQNPGDWESYLRSLSALPTSMSDNISNSSSCVHASAVNVVPQPVLTASGPAYGKLDSVNIIQPPQNASHASQGGNSTQPMRSVSHATSALSVLQEPMQSESYANSIIGALQPSLHSASHTSAINVLQQPLQLVNPTTRLLMDQESPFSDRINSLNITEDGYATGVGIWEGLSTIYPSLSSNAYLGPAGPHGSSMVDSQMKAGETVKPSNVDSTTSSGAGSDGLLVTSSSTLSPWKNPVGRPVRHFGPPPGFNSLPSKQLNGTFSTSSWKDDQNNLVDDYRWLDGYSPAKSENGDSLYYTQFQPQVSSGINKNLSEAMIFPFPGKQIPSVQTHVECDNGWQDYQLIQRLKLYADKQAQKGNQQPGSALDQAQPLWPNPYFV